MPDYRVTRTGPDTWIATEEGFGELGCLAGMAIIGLSVAGLLSFPFWVSATIVTMVFEAPALLALQLVGGDAPDWMYYLGIAASTLLAWIGWHFFGSRVVSAVGDRLVGGRQWVVWLGVYVLLYGVLIGHGATAVVIGNNMKDERVDISGGVVGAHVVSFVVLAVAVGVGGYRSLRTAD